MNNNSTSTNIIIFQTKKEHEATSIGNFLSSNLHFMSSELPGYRYVLLDERWEKGTWLLTWIKQIEVVMVDETFDLQNKYHIVVYCLK